MVKATFNGKVIAESDETKEVEGNQYFPPGSVKKEYLKRNQTEKYTCPWKGETSYYDVVVDGKVASAAAWAYHDPKPAAKEITDHYAFWREVVVE